MVTPGLHHRPAGGLLPRLRGRRSSSRSPAISLGIVTVLVLLGLTHAYFRPRWDRGIELAERDLKAGGELSEEFRSNSRQMAIAGMLMSLLVIVTIFFMVVKP